MKHKDVLANSDLLKHFELEEIDYYIKRGDFKVVTYTKNSVLYFENDPCKKLQIILSGKVLAEKFDENGRLNTTYEFYADDMLEGALIFDDKPNFPATITTKEPTTILEIKKDTLFELLSSNPSFLHKYLNRIAKQTYSLINILEYSLKKSIRESILIFLKNERLKQNSNHIKLRTTKKALADKFGVQRTSLSRELANMKNEGLVTYDAKSITIKYTID